MSECNNYESQVPVYLFHQGNNARAYEYMGSHRVDENTVLFPVIRVMARYEYGTANSIYTYGYCVKKEENKE